MPTQFTHKEFYHTYVQIDTKGHYLDELLNCLAHQADKFFDTIHNLFRRHNIDLLAVCFEAEGDKTASHPHFHFLLNLDVPPTEQVPNNFLYTKVNQIIRRELVAKLKAMGIADLSSNTFVKYKGTGYGATPIDDNPKHICPKTCSNSCLYKSKCFNDMKPKSCANIMIRLDSARLAHTYDYIRYTKTTPITSKQYYKFYEPISPQHKLSLLYVQANSSQIKSC